LKCSEPVVKLRAQRGEGDRMGGEKRDELIQVMEVVHLRFDPGGFSEKKKIGNGRKDS